MFAIKRTIVDPNTPTEATTPEPERLDGPMMMEGMGLLKFIKNYSELHNFHQQMFQCLKTKQVV
jgi:hypothetical protein